MVRRVENLAEDIKRGFEQRDQRVIRFKKLEGRRRRQVLKDSVRAIQAASTSTRSKFVAELEQYEPPLEPVGEGSELDGNSTTTICKLLQRISREESETMKSIVSNLREGMSVQKLLRIARDTKQSQDVDAQNARVDQLLHALDLSLASETLRKDVFRILHESCELPLPKNPKMNHSLECCSSSTSDELSSGEDGMDNHGSGSESSEDADAPYTQQASRDDGVQALLDYVARGPPPQANSKTRTPSIYRHQL